MKEEANGERFLNSKPVSAKVSQGLVPMHTSPIRNICTGAFVAGLALAKAMEDIEINTLREKLFALYADFGGNQQAAFMGEAVQRAAGFDRYKAVDNYNKFLKRCSDIQVIKKGLSLINDQALKDNMWLTRMAAAMAMKDLGGYFSDKSLTDAAYGTLKETVEQYLSFIKQNDKDARIRKL